MHSSTERKFSQRDCRRKILVIHAYFYVNLCLVSISLSMPVAEVGSEAVVEWKRKRRISFLLKPPLSFLRDMSSY
jgi:hypothetical protein